jgi:hypothetical protein
MHNFKVYCAVCLQNYGFARAKFSSPIFALFHSPNPLLTQEGAFTANHNNRNNPHHHLPTAHHPSNLVHLAPMRRMGTHPGCAASSNIVYPSCIGTACNVDRDEPSCCPCEPEINADLFLLPINQLQSSNSQKFSRVMAYER